MLLLDIYMNIEDIYNPWSIISFLKKDKYEPYWANTSSNSLVSKLVREGDAEIKKAFEELLNDGVIQTKIDGRPDAVRCIRVNV